MVALRPKGRHRRLPLKPPAETAHVRPEGGRKEAEVAFTSVPGRKEGEVEQRAEEENMQPVRPLNAGIY